MTDEDVASIFVAGDPCPTECVGLAPRDPAGVLEPIRQGVRERFGAFAAGIAGGLKLRHDHGSLFLADDFQAEIAFRQLARLRP